MEKSEYGFIRRVILILTSLYAISGIIMISLIFSYFNQSSNTPKEEQLTFLNFLLPLILSIGFIIYQTLKKIRTNKNDKTNNWYLKAAILNLDKRVQKTNKF